MNKRGLNLILIIILSITSTYIYCQDKSETFKTKTDIFLSKTGSIIRYVDYSTESLQTKYNNCETRVRKLSNSSSTTLYVYQIVSESKYGPKIASIEYSDLIEIIKALEILKSNATKDLSSPNYIENKFITNDGFQIGYYVKNSEVNWFIKLEKYGTDNTIFLNDINAIEKSFMIAKNKIALLISSGNE